MLGADLGSLTTLGPRTVRPDDSLAEVLDLMERFGFHHVPVATEDRLVVGMISDRDVVAALLGQLTAVGVAAGGWEAPSPLDYTASCQAADLMTRPVLVVDRGATPAGALRLLLERAIHCLPVVAGDQTLVGIVTSTDFLREFCRAGLEPVSDLVARHMVACGLQIDMSTSPFVASQLMEEHELHCLVVTERGRPIGIISQRSVRAYVRRLWQRRCWAWTPEEADGEILHEDSLLSMCDSLATGIDSQQPLLAAGLQMLELGLQVLPVHDQAGELLGLVREEEILAAVVARLD